MRMDRCCTRTWGAPANVAVAAGRLGAHTAFIGKAGNDMQGKFLRSVLEKENAVVWNKQGEKCHLIGAMKTNAFFTLMEFVLLPVITHPYSHKISFHLVTVKGREYYHARYQGNLSTKSIKPLCCLPIQRKCSESVLASFMYLCSDLSLLMWMLEHYSTAGKSRLCSSSKSIWA